MLSFLENDYPIIREITNFEVLRADGQLLHYWVLKTHLLQESTN